MAHMQQKARDHRQRETDARDVHALEVLAVLPKEPFFSHVANTDAVLLIVPDNPQRVVEQPAENIAEFWVHLEQIMQQAEEQVEDTDLHESIQTEHESRAVQQQTSLPVINACTSCRGACCLQGKGHAFLNQDFFAWRLLNELDSSPRQKIEDYISRIPEEGYENSCVYHGAEGCVLPREIRSSTCNRFLCTGILDGLRRDENRKSLSSIAVVDANGVQRVGLANSDGHRTEFPVNECGGD